MWARAAWIAMIIIWAILVRDYLISHLPENDKRETTATIGWINAYTPIVEMQGRIWKFVPIFDMPPHQYVDFFPNSIDIFNGKALGELQRITVLRDDYGGASTRPISGSFLFLFGASFIYLAFKISDAPRNPPLIRLVVFVFGAIGFGLILQGILFALLGMWLSDFL